MRVVFSTPLKKNWTNVKNWIENRARQHWQQKSKQREISNFAVKLFLSVCGFLCFSFEKLIAKKEKLFHGVEGKYNMRMGRRWRKIFRGIWKKDVRQNISHRLTYNHWRIKRVLADWTENSRLLILQFVEFRDISIRF